MSVRANGIDEQWPPDPYRKYGCSEGTADQYIDYARTFGLLAVRFRMSCICGPHQMGNEDQGWVAHFLIHVRRPDDYALRGWQAVHGVLYVENLVDEFLLVRAEMPRIAGQLNAHKRNPETSVDGYAEQRR
jgi:CDP-paratose 2-epimerase